MTGLQDLFSQNKFATHKRTGTGIYVIKPIWLNGELHYDCVVPQGEDLCNATYSDKELSFNEKQEN